MAPRRTRSIPAARVVGLKDLQARMATANDIAYHLDYTSEPEDFEKVMEALHEAYWIAADLAKKRTRTGCADHPHGPVDPVAPEGWGTCLICNGRRRSGKQARTEREGEILLTGATSEVNRPAETVAAALQPTAADPRWRMQPHEERTDLDSPILAARRAGVDRTHAAALARARQERAAKAKAETAAKNRAGT
ncbi:hypothetical protein ACFWXA_13100 [Streptomyces atroolivaceus]|uniref:hypothetical protein n=1 Tax=Streptomyces atroolivaceus TaxID=66869 RepID=UPI00364EB234